MEARRAKCGKTIPWGEVALGAGWGKGFMQERWFASGVI